MIYLDSAATTLQKPPSVSKAAATAIRNFASPGRGGYAPAARAEEAVFACREAAGELFNVPPEQVVFTSSATHGLNIAIKSVVRPGDTVLVTGYEHNAVARPLAAIPGVKVRVAASPLFRQEELLQSFKEQLDDTVSAVVVNHVSNVFGYIMPVSEMADLCRMRRVPFLLDASQSAGILPVDVEALGALFAACPGHKGLYGPQGTGLLLCGKDAKTQPLMEGGTGSLSAFPHMPDFLPDRLEPGTHNVPGIAGLLEGLRFVKEKGIARIFRHEQALLHQAAEGLRQMGHVRVFAAAPIRHQAAVLSFQVEGIDCQDVADALGKKGVAVRAGLHCAPYAHSSAGTLELGTVRASFSAFNTRGEVLQFLQAVRGLRR